MNKKEFWPKEGKLKKGLIILAIVIASALAIVLIEEKTTIKVSKKITIAIAFASLAIWLYNPEKSKDTTLPS